MKPTKDSAFIGTNILLYCYSKTEPDKKVKALEADCKILYTEDLQHKQLIENKLTIINPFKS